MLTVLLQVRYHREEGKCRAGAHGPGSQRRCTRSGSNEGITGGGRGDERAQGVQTEPQGWYKREGASTRRVRGVRMSAGGFERAQGVRTEPQGRYKRERASMRGGQGVQTSTWGMNGAPGMVQTSAGGYKRARGVRTSMRGARGIERTSTGGTNIAGAAVGAARPSSLVPLLLPPLSNLF